MISEDLDCEKKKYETYCKCRYYFDYIKIHCFNLTKLAAAEEEILDLRISLEMGCMTIAGMIGVNLAAARSSIFLATAKVSTLLK